MLVELNVVFKPIFTKVFWFGVHNFMHILSMPGKKYLNGWELFGNNLSLL